MVDDAELGQAGDGPVEVLDVEAVLGHDESRVDHDVDFLWEVKRKLAVKEGHDIVPDDVERLLHGDCGAFPRVHNFFQNLGWKSSCVVVKGVVSQNLFMKVSDFLDRWISQIFQKWGSPDVPQILVSEQNILKINSWEV